MAISLIIGLSIGNFIIQAITKKDWWLAFERSVLQAVAIGCYYLLTH